VPDPCTYDYAVVRVVPHVERGEFVNAGVIVSCSARGFLQARIELDEARVLALDPTLDLESLRLALAAIPVICAGGAPAGPLGALAARKRFDWLVAPRSASIQTSAVHVGRCTDLEAALEHLVARMVRRPAARRAPVPVEPDEASVAGEEDPGASWDIDEMPLAPPPGAAAR